jgi:hypothetical protein
LETVSAKEERSRKKRESVEGTAAKVPMDLPVGAK